MVTQRKCKKKHIIIMVTREMFLYLYIKFETEKLKYYDTHISL